MLLERSEDVAERPWWQQGERVAALLGVVVIVCLLSFPLIVGVRQRASDQATATAAALAAAVRLATGDAQSTATAEQRSTATAQTAAAQSAATQAAVALGSTQTAAAQAALDATTSAQAAAAALAATQAALDATTAAQAALEATTAAQAQTATALAIPTSTPTPVVPALVPGALETALIPAEEIELRRTSHSALVASYRLLRQETFDSPQTKKRWNENRNDPAAPRRFSGSYQLAVSPSALANSDFWRERGLGASYIVELDVSLPTPGTWAGIRFDAAGDGSADRTFAVSDMGTWQLITRRSGQADSALTTMAQTSGAIRGASEINTLRVVRLPHEIQLWVSNTPVAVIPVDVPGGGQVGVAGLADGRLAGPAIVHVDNFKIWEP